MRLLIKREDLIHPVVSGNKWHKLKYNLIEARAQGFDTLLSFGGAYSNHIHALAGAGHELGFKTIGVIRGEEYSPLNPTLQFAVNHGMRLHYLCRSDYRRKTQPDIIRQLHEMFGNFYCIPEGGSNALAVKGCAEIAQNIEHHFNVICTACGTGGTLAGLVAGLKGDKEALGFAVLKDARFLLTQVTSLLEKSTGCSFSNWDINPDYHFGGYAKTNGELIGFINTFTSKHNISLEPIYTGKMMYGIYDLISHGYFQRGQTILAVHTGGLQGLVGMQKRQGRQTLSQHSHCE